LLSNAHFLLQRVSLFLGVNVLPIIGQGQLAHLPWTSFARVQAGCRTEVIPGPGPGFTLQPDLHQGIGSLHQQQGSPPEQGIQELRPPLA
jgi:hypothetical protein